MWSPQVLQGAFPLAPGITGPISPADQAAMDTNGDGQITFADNPCKSTLGCLDIESFLTSVHIIIRHSVLPRGGWLVCCRFVHHGSAVDHHIFIPVVDWIGTSIYYFGP